MQLYQFERIYSQMEKEFGKMKDVREKKQIPENSEELSQEMLKSYYKLPVIGKCNIF